jgi:hypothetical protein
VLALAELDVRHTRRHQPTRRVAVPYAHLPVDRGQYGAVLVGAVVAATVDGLLDEQAQQLPAFLAEARQGPIAVPTRRLRFRLQTDVHGLARSRHRLLGEDGGLVVELDLHSQYPGPQLIAAVWAAAGLATRPRDLCLRAIERAVSAPGVFPGDVTVRVRTEIPPTFVAPGFEPLAGPVADWSGIASDVRWAMEVLGYGPGDRPTRDDVQRRYRRLLRLAHPDHGGEADHAAQRIEDLAEARRALFGDLDGAAGPGSGSQAAG